MLKYAVEGHEQKQSHGGVQKVVFIDVVGGGQMITRTNSSRVTMVRNDKETNDCSQASVLASEKKIVKRNLFLKSSVR